MVRGRSSENLLTTIKNIYEERLEGTISWSFSEHRFAEGSQSFPSQVVEERSVLPVAKREPKRPSRSGLATWP
jgi:hypothetical protein